MLNWAYFTNTRVNQGNETKIITTIFFFLINHSFAITIDDLETKSIFRTFYPSMVYATFEGKDGEEIKLPHIGIEKIAKNI
ncbi:hypothetical protein ACWPO9_01805 [Acinetobacter nosocomialis]|nr:hypothetical protein [Acinetobacter nosocomialis]OUT25601.1 hypothetical protein H125_15842 [Acinetobacter nosocomialis P020]PSE16186.1 hypothetical protein C7G95_06600 [Acinetobacter nosocomialis]